MLQKPTTTKTEQASQKIQKPEIHLKMLKYNYTKRGKKKTKPQLNNKVKQTYFQIYMAKKQPVLSFGTFSLDILGHVREYKQKLYRDGTSKKKKKRVIPFSPKFTFIM